MIPAAPAAIQGRVRSNERIATLNPSPSPPTIAVLADLHVLEDDVGGVGAALPHLVLFLPDRDARRVAVDHEAGDPLVARGALFAREDRIEAGHPPVGDPALLPGDDVVVADLLEARLHAGHVRAGVGLRAAIGGEDRLGQEAPEVLLLLRVGAGDDERHRPQHVGGHRGVDAGAAVGDLLQHQAVRQARQAEAAVGLGELAVHEPRLPPLLADLLGERPVLVQLAGDRDDLLAREVARRFTELLFLVGELEVGHGGRISLFGRFRCRRRRLTPRLALFALGGLALLEARSHRASPSTPSGSR